MDLTQQTTTFLNALRVAGQRLADDPFATGWERRYGENLAKGALGALHRRALIDDCLLHMRALIRVRGYDKGLAEAHRRYGTAIYHAAYGEWEDQNPGLAAEVDYDPTAPDPHPVGQMVEVYLQFDPARRAWVVDPRTVDGYPLVGEDRPSTDCDGDCGDSAACAAAIDQANAVRLPTGQELAELLVDAVQAA